MALEVGLKMTKSLRDVDASSSSDIRVSKDPLGPLWFSRETKSAFFLILHIKGYKKDYVDIEITKDGNRIKISGRKPVEEMVLMKSGTWKKEMEIKEFSKVFRIPENVKLNRIQARFNDEEGTLTITMPKKVRGIFGIRIEEEVEEKRVEPEEIEKEEEEEEKKEEFSEEVTPQEDEKTEEAKTEEVESKELEKDNEQDNIEEVEEEPIEEIKKEKIEEPEKVEEDLKEKDEGNEKLKKRKRNRCRLPFLAGSSLLMSIIFFIFHLIESKTKKK